MYTVTTGTYIGVMAGKLTQLSDNWLPLITQHMFMCSL